MGFAKSSAWSARTSALWNSLPFSSGTGRVGRSAARMTVAAQAHAAAASRRMTSRDIHEGARPPLLPAIVAPCHLDRSALARHHVEREIRVGSDARAQLGA